MTPKLIAVGGFNPSEKYARQIGSSPQNSGWKSKIFELPPPSYCGWGFSPCHIPTVGACIDFEVSILGGLFHPTSTSTDVRLDEAELKETTRFGSCSRYTKRENPVDKKSHRSSTENILSILVYSSYKLTTHFVFQKSLNSLHLKTCFSNVSCFVTAIACVVFKLQKTFGKSDRNGALINICTYQHNAEKKLTTITLYCLVHRDY